MSTVVHNHPLDSRRVDAARRLGNLMFKSISSIGSKLTEMNNEDATETGLKFILWEDETS